jgi:hypothetical protein
MATAGPTAVATGRRTSHRFDAFPDGRACLIVLHLNDPRGHEYYLWNGSALAALPAIRSGRGRRFDRRSPATPSATATTPDLRPRNGTPPCLEEAQRRRGGLAGRRAADLDHDGRSTCSPPAPSAATISTCSTASR